MKKVLTVLGGLFLALLVALGAMAGFGLREVSRRWVVRALPQVPGDMRASFLALNAAHGIVVVAQAPDGQRSIIS